MRILIQFPEGLKSYALDIAKKLENEGHEVYISASPCYGACDLALDEAKALKVDKIIHFGHNKFIKTDVDIEIEYIPFSINFPVEIIESSIEKLKKENIKSIALCTTVQHIHQIKEMESLFKKNGIEVYLKSGYWATEKGQILGCDSLACDIKEAEAIVFVGDGLFHPLGIKPGKRVFTINKNGIKEITDLIEKLDKKRKASLIQAYSAKTFGILVSTKIGQFNLNAALWAKKVLEKHGKQAFILVANELNPASIYNFMRFDCYVNTACPRIVDDTEAYGKPIINISMLKELTELWATKGKNINNIENGK